MPAKAKYLGDFFLDQIVDNYLSTIERVICLHKIDLLWGGPASFMNWTIEVTA